MPEPFMMLAKREKDGQNAKTIAQQTQYFVAKEDYTIRLSPLSRILEEI